MRCGDLLGHVLVIFGVALADIGARQPHFGAERRRCWIFSRDILSGTTSTMR